MQLHNIKNIFFFHGRNSYTKLWTSIKSDEMLDMFGNNLQFMIIIVS